MIEVSTYCISCFLKRAQVFTLLKKHLQYQAKKESRVVTNPKCVL